MDGAVRHVMVPRMDLAFISTARTAQENLAVVRATGHSRFPLADPDLDHVDGYVHTRALLAHLLKGETVDPASLRQRCPVVPDTQPLSRLILELQQQQVHCAQVIDEHGATVGFAFLEDALEEIVGPIHDEFDQKTERIQELAPGVFELAGSVPLPEASAAMSLEPDDEADTVGGLVTSRLKRLPAPGDQLEIGDYRVTVVAVAGRRVNRVRFEIIPSKDGRTEP